jgi:hypothetical protein
MPRSIDPAELRTIGRRLRKAIGQATGVREPDLGPDAIMVWTEKLYPEFAALDDEESAVVSGFTQRSAPYCRRIAMATAALDNRRLANLTDLESAAALVRYSIGSVRYLMGSARDPRLDRLQRTADEAYPELLSRTWIINSLFRKHVSTEDIQAMIDTLCTDEMYRDSRGRKLYEEREIPRDGGGRPRRLFGRVVPLLLRS